MLFRPIWKQRGPVGPTLAAVLLVVGLTFWAMTTGNRNKDKLALSGGGVDAELSTDQLASVARTRVFFGHQSVGMNVLDGVRGVYAAHGLAAPPIEQDTIEPGASGGFIDHTFLGENEKPLTKLKAFDAAIRGGLGDRVDIAMMKFCYIDITGHTDVDALFAAYRTTMDALQRDYPNVRFVHVTVPLMTEPGFLLTVRMRVTGNDRFGPAENVARERLNTLIRRTYGHDHLFDLARAESTAPDGSRVSGTQDGQPYYALYEGYASDSGHLNTTGQRVAATALLMSLAQARAR